MSKTCVKFPAHMSEDFELEQENEILDGQAARQTDMIKTSINPVFPIRQILDSSKLMKVAECSSNW